MFWYQYRDVWARHPWIAAVALLAVLFIIGGIAGSVLRNLLALFFIPGLILLYAHHLLVQRKAENL
jgi:uncharacterized membrane protein YcjF (UPF0283 family)